MAVDPATGYKLCKRGHVRSPDNVDAWGACRECKMAYGRARQQARRVHFRVGAVRWSAYVDNKQELQAAVANFKTKQRDEYQEAMNG